MRYLAATRLLDGAHRLARRLRPLRPMLLALGVLGVMASGLGLFAFAPPEGDVILLPGLLALLWSGTALIGIEVLAHAHPARAIEPHDWLERLLTRLWDGARWTAAALLVALGLLTTDLSLHIADRWMACAPADLISR